MIVVDTHVLYGWLGRMQGVLSPAATKAIRAEETGGGAILVSSITAWELALLTKAGKLTLAVPLSEWLTAAALIPCVEFVPVDTNIAVESVMLPDPLHRDPADRIIVATARHLNAPLVTRDERLRAYPHVVTIW
jgi:PIN domain nuclease of toxin-antitoxin system